MSKPDPIVAVDSAILPEIGQGTLRHREGRSATRTIDAEWTCEDTDPGHVFDALRLLEMTPRPDGSSAAPARALTLVVIVDPEHDGEVRDQLRALGSSRASRTIILRRERDRTTLGARVTVIADSAIGHGLRETVVLDVGEDSELDLDGIIDPLVLPDVPTVAWSPQGDPRRLMLLREVVRTAIIDGDRAVSVREALDDSRALREVGMRTIDLAWLRSAPWRVRLAALAEQPGFRAQLDQIAQLQIETRPDSRYCGALLAAWFTSRLRWHAGPPLLDARRQRVVAQLRDVEQTLPGLAGVTMVFRDGTSRRLSRGPGGLRITDTDVDGNTSERTAMGASRGGSGLLPNALRQVLLPDPLDDAVLEAAASLDRSRVLRQVDGR
jgi:glucose-6-phosphate dehydrogenase assembly protein OpcA